MTKRILVAGVGNLLFTDEGIGVHLVKELSKRELDDDVEVIEVGTATIDLPALMKNKDKVIIVDGVLSDDPPGSILRLHPEDLKAGDTRTLTSVHQFGIAEALATASQMGFDGEVVILVAVPKDYRTPSTELTPELAQALPNLVKAVLAEL
jgi:hydrogenase maturation protease